MDDMEDFRKFYDPDDTSITMDLKRLKITTTSATTQLEKVNIKGIFLDRSLHSLIGFSFRILE